MYTYFDRKKKVLCVIQVIEDAESAQVNWDTVMPHNDGGTDKYDVEEDSSTAAGGTGISTTGLYD